MKERAFEDAAKALKAGEIVCIFPEGAITSTGELQRFRPGLQRILEQAPVPVVPMALWTLGQFLQPDFEGQGDAAVARRVLANCAGRGRTVGASERDT